MLILCISQSHSNEIKPLNYRYRTEDCGHGVEQAENVGIPATVRDLLLFFENLLPDDLWPNNVKRENCSVQSFQRRTSNL